MIKTRKTVTFVPSARTYKFWIFIIGALVLFGIQYLEFSIYDVGSVCFFPILAYADRYLDRHNELDRTFHAVLDDSLCFIDPCFFDFEE